MDELKPCPFCGWDPHIAETEITYLERHIMLRVKCVGCGAEVTLRGSVGKGQSVLAAFLNLWNRRCDDAK